MAKKATKKVEKVEKITELTPAQEAQLDVYRDKWLAIGLSTERTDFEAAKIVVAQAYAAAGLPAPQRYLYAKSPLDAIEVLKNYEPLDPKESYANAKDKKAKVSEYINSMSFGSHDAGWLSFYEFFRDVCDLDCCKPLDGLIALAKVSGWVAMYDEVAVIQDRPGAIHFDEEKRLHCETGPAIEYHDGNGVYSWHGTRIPGDWIENREKLSAKIALTWENVEQRRAACEILGWVNVLKELNATVIDEDDDPEIGTLVEVDLPDLGKEKFLKVLCGTGRMFAIPVPPETKTALEGNAWTFDIDPNLLKNLEVRT